ncbi:MAG: GIY-YIG nuclease family protein, partial [bacterium]
RRVVRQAAWRIRVLPEELIFTMPFYVYILQSKSTGKIYVGQTMNLANRLEQHNDPEHKLTLHTKRNRGPWHLIYSEEYQTRAEAMRRERFFKTGRGRELIQEIIKDSC